RLAGLLDDQQRGRHHIQMHLHAALFSAGGLMAGSPARSRTHSQGFGAYEEDGGQPGSDPSRVQPVLHGPNAHATISGNSSRQNAPPCDPARSVITTSAPASRSATAHRVAFSRKNGSSVPATRYARGIGPGITPGGRHPAPGQVRED